LKPVLQNLEREMPVNSAGLLMYHKSGSELKVFLVHPGGPFFAKKDDGYWGIPKGLVEENEEPLQAALREFKEETGIKPKGKYIHLGTTTQTNNKIVHAWAFESYNSEQIRIICNTFEMEWPPHSGRKQKFPEVDRGEFFSITEARKKVYSAQSVFIDRLLAHLNIKEIK
jgi:predicted NUDIX family NTP pyrophosphohydrolase